MNRRSTAPTWQQRGVNIDASPTRKGQHGLRQDQTICHHHQDIWIPGRKIGTAFLSLQSLRLRNRKSVFKGHLLDGTRCRTLAATFGSVWLREYADKRVLGTRQRMQRRHRKIRRSRERYSKRGQ